MELTTLLLAVSTIAQADGGPPAIGSALEQFRAGQIGRPDLAQVVSAAAPKGRLGDADLRLLLEALDQGDEPMKQAVVWSLRDLKRADGKEIARVVYDDSPKVLSQSKARYPEEGRSKRIQGVV